MSPCQEQASFPMKFEKRSTSRVTPSAGIVRPGTARPAPLGSLPAPTGCPGAGARDPRRLSACGR